jgi:hypothetical protein
MNRFTPRKRQFAVIVTSLRDVINATPPAGELAASPQGAHQRFVETISDGVAAAVTALAIASAPALDIRNLGARV